MDLRLTTYDVKLANDVEAPAEGWFLTLFRKFFCSSNLLQ